MKASITERNVAGETVLLRCDYNVPMDHGMIVDDRRMVMTLPTIHWLCDHGAKVIVMTHLGRPKGSWREELSTRPLAARLGELLKKEVAWVPDLVGDRARALCTSLQEGQVGMIENLRFDAGEEANDARFAEGLASLGTLYCNDAFGTAHRAHASTVGVARLLPAACGLLMRTELQFLTPLNVAPERPYLALVAGSKISSKLKVLTRLRERADDLVLGGAMACTFLKAKGLKVGRSLVEEDQIPLAAALLEKTGAGMATIHLPVDVVVTDNLASPTNVRVVPAVDIPDDAAVADVGPATCAMIRELIKAARTAVWNGPFGIYETPPFGEGTRAIAAAFAECSGTSVLGGGDVVAALEGGDEITNFTHVSTGGGATIEFLEGEELPGIAVLPDDAAVAQGRL